MSKFNVITSEKIRVEALSLDILNQISRIANSTLDLQERLDAIVDIVMHKMEKDGCAVFLLNDNSSLLACKAVTGFATEAVAAQKFNASSGLLGKVIKDRTPLVYSDIRHDQQAKYLVEPCFEKFNSVLAVPILMDEKFIGIISLNTVKISEYDQDEITLLSTVANDIAGIIKTSLLYQEQKKRLEHFEIIQKISKAVNSTLNLDHLLQMIIEHSVDAINARGGVLKLRRETENRWITKSYCGKDEEFCNLIIMEQSGENEIIDKVTASKNVMIFNNFKDSSFQQDQNLMCAPLISRGNLVGIISLYEKKGSRCFTEDDKRLISTLSDQASIAIENARLYSQKARLAEENRKRLLRITVIYKISTALKTSLNQETLADITLSGITMGGGLGFNRALLFMVDKNRTSLVCKAAVGPDSREEANRIWSELEAKGIDRQDITRWILVDEHNTLKNQSGFSRSVNHTTIPIVDKSCIFSRAILKKKAVIVNDPYANKQLTGSSFWSDYQADEFAIIPLITESDVMGVLVVDNVFTKKPITDEDLEFTKMLANHAALAFENSIIHAKIETAIQDLREAQEKIVESEKMVALGELATNVAHEIRNPMLAINGFVSRIRKSLPDNKELGQYGDIIIAESHKLERVLEEILVYSGNLRRAKDRLEQIDINQFINDYINDGKELFAAKKIELITHFRNDIMPLWFNRYQLKQVLVNLFSNAEQAMERTGGIITIETGISGQNIFFSILNTGDAIPPDVISNIFNPFFTTKKKGTGLGLAIVHKIIFSNNGLLAVENLHAGGVRFTVTLPANNPDNKTWEHGNG